MPFYEYECGSCSHHVEVLQKISDAPLRKCPDCGKQALKRLMSAPVFRLKGGGWYETDFKSESEQKRNLAGREDEAKSDEKVEAKNDESKPETPKETESSSKPSEGKKAKVVPAKPAKVAAAKPAAAKPAGKPVAKSKVRPAARKSANKAAGRR